MKHCLRCLLSLCLWSLVACQLGEPWTEQGAAEVVAAEPYQSLTKELDAYVQAQIKGKQLPGLSVAVLSGDEVLWAKGYGFSRAKDRPITPQSLCRVGSISKLFVATAILKLAEQGKLELDAPVRKYLPGLRFDGGQDDAVVTLRHLLGHHGGIRREPPVGNYFDPSTPTLAATVASMQGTPLVYRPGQRFKYSNAGFAILGRVVEVVSGKPFERAMQDLVIEPAGLVDSRFRLAAQGRQRLATGFMWGYDREPFAAPTFDLGMAPAADLYATVLDLVQFARQAFVGEHRPENAVLQEASLKKMFRPSFKKQSRADFVGLGWFLDQELAELRVSHTGAMYGFASVLQVLPERGLAVAVVANLDFADRVPSNVAERALRLLVARQDGSKAKPAARTRAVGAAAVARHAGWYGRGSYRVRVYGVGDEMYLEPPSGFRRRLRRIDGGANWVADDRFQFGGRYRFDEGGLMFNGTKLPRLPGKMPAACAKEWRELIGEYGHDSNVLYVLERAGRLCILIEAFALYPLQQVEERVFVLPDGGMYPGEEVRFDKLADGRIARVVVGGVAFLRRAVPPDGTKPFRIKALYPPEKLRAMARQLRAPRPKAIEDRAPDLVELDKTIPGVRLDLRYGTTNNFLATKFYRKPMALMQRPAAEALAKVQARLAQQGYGLMVYDAYRPWQVTQMFWDATPKEQKHFVANPKNGSRHNRGCAVDVGLVHLADGTRAEMPSGYDEFTRRAYPDYPGGTARARYHARILRQAMAAEGFSVYEFEWWHFDYKDWQRYPVMDRRL